MADDQSKQEYETNLKKLIRNEILIVLGGNNKSIEKRHSEILEKLNSLSAKVDSIDGYKDTLISIDTTMKISRNLSKVSSWIFKNLIIPVSVVTGIWFSVKNSIK